MVPHPGYLSLGFHCKFFCFVWLWVLRELLKTQARLSRLFLSRGDQYLLSYDVFADEFSAPSLQNRANIIRVQNPYKIEKPPTKNAQNLAEYEYEKVTSVAPLSLVLNCTPCRTSASRSHAQCLRCPDQCDYHVGTKRRYRT